MFITRNSKGFGNKLSGSFNVKLKVIKIQQRQG